VSTINSGHPGFGKLGIKPGMQAPVRGSNQVEAPATRCRRLYLNWFHPAPCSRHGAAWQQEYEE
jgi:hypothetical protein